MNEIADLTAAQILGFSVTSGIVTFALNTAYSTYKDRTAAKLDVQHTALRVALALEKYAIACGTCLSDSGTWHASGGSDGAAISKLPELELPAGIDWKRLDHTLANRALSLDNVINYGNGAIHFELGYNDPDERCVQGELQAGHCGYLAIRMAQELRNKYRLPPMEPLSKWDFRKFLKQKHDDYVATQVEYPE